MFSGQAECKMSAKLDAPKAVIETLRRTKVCTARHRKLAAEHRLGSSKTCMLVIYDT